MISIEQIVLLIIFIIVLFLVVYLLFFGGKPGIDKLLLQNELRQCCQAYRANGCPNRAGAAFLFCDSKTLTDIIDALGIDNGNPNLDQTKSFCSCPT